MDMCVKAAPPWSRLFFRVALAYFALDKEKNRLFVYPGRCDRTKVPIALWLKKARTLDLDSPEFPG
jgi:hypothetical protein